MENKEDNLFDGVRYTNKAQNVKMAMKAACYLGKDLLEAINFSHKAYVELNQLREKIISDNNIFIAKVYSSERCHLMYHSFVDRFTLYCNFLFDNQDRRIYFYDRVLSHFDNSCKTMAPKDTE